MTEQRIIWPTFRGGPHAGKPVFEVPEGQWQIQLPRPVEPVGLYYADGGTELADVVHYETDIYQLQPVCQSYEPRVLAWVHYMADVQAEVGDVWAEFCRLATLGRQFDDEQRRKEEDLLDALNRRAKQRLDDERARWQA